MTVVSANHCKQKKITNQVTQFQSADDEEEEEKDDEKKRLFEM